MRFGAFRYDTETRQLYRGNDMVPLSPRSLAVLGCLLEGAGLILSKDELLAAGWHNAYVGEDSLTQAVSRLRDALGDDAHDPQFIQTVPKRGYRFIGRIDNGEDSAAVAGAFPPVVTAPSRESSISVATTADTTATFTSATAITNTATFTTTAAITSADAPARSVARLAIEQDEDHVTVWAAGAQAVQVTVRFDADGVRVSASRVVMSR